MKLSIGFAIGAFMAVYTLHAVVSKAFDGYWPWECPFAICEDCWWAGRTRIYEFAPCPRCHKWFMRIGGFNLTLETLDLYLEHTGRILVGVRPVPIERTVSDWGGLASRKEEIIRRDQERLKALGYLEG